MKIRTNFVSNSSSSSFILTVNKELFDKALQEWKPSEEYLATFNKDLDKIKCHLEKECKRLFKVGTLFNTEVYKYQSSCVYNDGFDDPFYAALYEVLESISDDQKLDLHISE